MDRKAYVDLPRLARTDDAWKKEVLPNEDAIIPAAEVPEANADGDNGLENARHNEDKLTDLGLQDVIQSLPRDQRNQVECLYQTHGAPEMRNTWLDKFRFLLYPTENGIDAAEIVLHHHDNDCQPNLASLKNPLCWQWHRLTHSTPHRLLRSGWWEWLTTIGYWLLCLLLVGLLIYFILGPLFRSLYKLVRMWWLKKQQRETTVLRIIPKTVAPPGVHALLSAVSVAPSTTSNTFFANNNRNSFISTDSVESAMVNESTELENKTFVNPTLGKEGEPGVSVLQSESQLADEESKDHQSLRHISSSHLKQADSGGIVMVTDSTDAKAAVVPRAVGPTVEEEAVEEIVAEVAQSGSSSLRQIVGYFTAPDHAKLPQSPLDLLRLVSSDNARAPLTPSVTAMFLGKVWNWLHKTPEHGPADGGSTVSLPDNPDTRLRTNLSNSSSTFSDKTLSSLLISSEDGQIQPLETESPDRDRVGTVVNRQASLAGVRVTAALPSPIPAPRLLMNRLAGIPQFSGSDFLSADSEDVTTHAITVLDSVLAAANWANSTVTMPVSVVPPQRCLARSTPSQLGAMSKSSSVVSPHAVIALKSVLPTAVDGELVPTLPTPQPASGHWQATEPAELAQPTELRSRLSLVETKKPPLFSKDKSPNGETMTLHGVAALESILAEVNWDASLPTVQTTRTSSRSSTGFRASDSAPSPPIRWSLKPGALLSAGRTSAGSVTVDGLAAHAISALDAVYASVD